MGLSCCGCISNQKMITPSSIPNLHLQQSHRSNHNKKFNDIQPLDIEDINISQLDLRSFNHQLSEYIVQYQIKNGKITKRFTKRMFTQHLINDYDFQKDKENYPNAIKITQQPKKQQIQQIQSYNNIQKLELKQQKNSLKMDQLIDDISSFSQNFDSELNQKNKSCLLSLSSRILNQSLFTQKNIQKSNFYKQYNNLLGVQLTKWTYNDRLSYDLNAQEILEINQVYKDNKFTICIASIYYYWIENCINLLCYNAEPNAIKIYLNGQPKLYPINSQQLSLKQIYNFTSKLNIHHITHLTHLLTGWIPQIINISQLKRVNEVIQRLSANLQEGNTLISFSKYDQNQNMQYTVLQKVDIQNQLIYMNSFKTKNTILPLFLETLQQDQISPEVKVISYQNFIQIFDYININWNPFIYQLRINQEGVLNQTCHENKYMVIIPPSSQDLQLRLMLQKHHNFQNQDDQQLIIKLYQYNNKTLGQPIRSITTHQLIYSDVFIFQSCQQKTTYLLSIGYKQPQMIEGQIVYTASLLSFAQIKFKPFKPKNYQNQICLQSQLTLDNVGYGINSPYFNKNLQFSINTQIGNDLQILISTNKKLVYEICIIPDINHNKKLNKIKLETIINNSQISNFNKGNGKLIITAQYQHYILILNAYSQVQSSININIKSYGYQINNKNLAIQKINNSIQVQFNQDIKWLPVHSGPRKRLKSNSNQQYQPLSIFQQFFNNPTIQKTLPKGKYQFYIKSTTYKEIFDSLQSNQDKNSSQPPALSMGIFLADNNKKLYKIIQDDAFYVPFGIGFWSAQMDLEEGCYKFVFPRMDKEFAQGNFGIIKC